MTLHFIDLSIHNKILQDVEQDMKFFENRVFYITQFHSFFPDVVQKRWNLLLLFTQTIVNYLGCEIHEVENEQIEIFNSYNKVHLFLKKTSQLLERYVIMFAQSYKKYCSNKFSEMKICFRRFRVCNEIISSRIILINFSVAREEIFDQNSRFHWLL